MNIPLFKPTVGYHEAEAVAAVLRSGWLGNGPKVREFEAAFADYIDTTYAVATNSCTAALHLALSCLDMEPGDEVIVPTITFCSTAHAVIYAGGVPVFADVKADTLCLDPASVAEKITPRTRAIVPVHYAGRPCDIPALERLAIRAPGLCAIVEDCAHAAGSTFHGRKLGAFGMAGCFSFHAVKNLACGDGGMMTTDNPVIAERCRRLAWMGIDRSTYDRTAAGGYDWRYTIPELGYKCHMNDITAAIGLVQLGRLEQGNLSRRIVARTYPCRLPDFVRTPPPEGGHARSAWHIYVIQCPTGTRDDLRGYLADRGITTGVHYQPLHTYTHVYGEQSSLPVAEAAAGRILSLPMFRGMTLEQVNEVAAAIEDFYNAR